MEKLPKYRIERDYRITMPILTDGEETSLEGRDLKIVISFIDGNRFDAEYTTEDNKATFRISASQQTTCGPVFATVYENYGQSGQTCFDRAMFELVPYSRFEKPNTTDLTVESITLSSTNMVAGVPGKDGVSVTHSWNGTVLTLTSASGTTTTDLAARINEDDLIDNLTSDATDKALTAKQGKVLKTLVDTKQDKLNYIEESKSQVTINKMTAINDSLDVDGSIRAEYSVTSAGDVYANEGDVSLVGLSTSKQDRLLKYAETSSGIVLDDNTHVEGTIDATDDVVTNGVSLVGLGAEVNKKLDTATYTTDKATFATKDELATKADQTSHDALAAKVHTNTELISEHFAEYSALDEREAKHHAASVTDIDFEPSATSVVLGVYKGGSQSPDHVDMPTMSDSTAGVVTPAQWATKANVSDLSTYETTSHASSTYLTNEAFVAYDKELKTSLEEEVVTPLQEYVEENNNRVGAVEDRVTALENNYNSLETELANI